jgi:hypothetical protein
MPVMDSSTESSDGAAVVVPVGLVLLELTVLPHGF